MANTSLRITRSVSKRLLEGDDVIVIHAKKWLKQQLLVHKDKPSTNLLSKKEQKLFHFDYWYRPKHTNSKRKATARKSHTYIVPFVRKAYLSIRRTASVDMAEILKDEVTRRALSNFTGVLRHMKEYSLCMKAIRTDLSRKLKIDGTTAFVPSEEAGPSAKPEELDRSKKGKCRRCSLIHARVSLMPSAKPGELETSGNGKAIRGSSVLIEGDNQVSIKVYNVLLILNEMLTLMGLQAENVEGYGHAELIGRVKDRMSVLKTEMKQEETLLIELINFVDKSECVSASDLLRSELSESLKMCISNHAEALSSNKEIYTAFGKLIDLMDEIWQTLGDASIWSLWPSRQAFLEFIKNYKSSSIYFPDH